MLAIVCYIEHILAYGYYFRKISKKPKQNPITLQRCGVTEDVKNTLCNKNELCLERSKVTNTTHHKTPERNCFHFWSDNEKRTTGSFCDNLKDLWKEIKMNTLR